MSARHFKLLNQLTEQTAETWPVYRVETAAPAQPFLRYNAATQAILSDMTERDIRGNEILRTPVPHGIAVLFRYCHIASLLAARDNASTRELTAALEADESFEPIDELLNSPLKVTSRAETELGLTPTQYPVSEHALANWYYGDSGSITVPNMKWTMVNARYDAALQSHNITSGSCPARSITRPLFASIIKICATDENLFERSLSEDPTKSSTSVIL